MLCGHHNEKVENPQMEYVFGDYVQEKCYFVHNARVVNALRLVALFKNHRSTKRKNHILLWGHIQCMLTAWCDEK